MRYDMLGAEVIVGMADGGDPPSPSTGWTTPAIIYTRMDEIDVHANALNAAISQNVRRADFITHWNDWLNRWKKFYEAYQTTSKRMAAPFFTDELASQVESFRIQLGEFQAAYDAEGDGSFPAVPGTPPRPPNPPAPEPKDASGIAKLSVPWWLWVLGGVAVAGGAYYVYGRIQYAREKNKQLQRMLPSVMMAEGVPPPLAQLAAPIERDMNAPATPNPTSPPFAYDAAGALYRRIT